jgi:hypothetical protein
MRECSATDLGERANTEKPGTSYVDDLHSGASDGALLVEDAVEGAVEVATALRQQLRQNPRCDAAGHRDSCRVSRAPIVDLSLDRLGDIEPWISPNNLGCVVRRRRCYFTGR